MPSECARMQGVGVEGKHECPNRCCYQKVPPSQLHWLAHPQQWEYAEKKLKELLQGLRVWLRKWCKEEGSTLTGTGEHFGEEGAYTQRWDPV